MLMPTIAGNIIRQSQRTLAFSRWGIVEIFLLALAVRVLWMVLLRGPIDTEGAEYARIAENLLYGNGYSGIAIPERELMFFPMFPFLIVVFLLLVQNS